jgi:hypothetical protein
VTSLEEVEALMDVSFDPEDERLEVESVLAPLTSSVLF